MGSPGPKQNSKIGGRGGVGGCPKPVAQFSDRLRWEWQERAEAAFPFLTSLSLSRLATASPSRRPGVIMCSCRQKLSILTKPVTPQPAASRIKKGGHSTLYFNGTVLARSMTSGVDRAERHRPRRLCSEAQAHLALRDQLTCFQVADGSVVATMVSVKHDVR